MKASKLVLFQKSRPAGWLGGWGLGGKGRRWGGEEEQGERKGGDLTLPGVSFRPFPRSSSREVRIRVPFFV